MIPMYEQIARAILSGQPTRLHTTRGYVRQVASDIQKARWWLSWHPQYDPTEDDDLECRFYGDVSFRRVSRCYALTIFRLVTEAHPVEPEPAILKFPGVA